MGKKRSKTSGAKRTGLIVLCCVLALILAALLVVTIAANRLLGQIQHPADTTLSSSEIEEILNDNTSAITGPTIREEDIDFGSKPTETTDVTEPTEKIESKDLINILLIGQDAKSATSWQKSEVIILCTINKKAKTLTVTSFLRDMYVQIPGYGNNKINIAYTIGGMELLDKCLKENFGIEVDANIAVNFDGFIKLVDMAGGVNIQLSAEEANYLNTRGNGGVTSADGWQLAEGENALTGAQAAGYARIRKLGGELERTVRQRKVIAALVERAKTMNLADLYDLAKQTASMISTDMTDSQIKAYITELAPMLADMKIVTQRIPVEGSYTFRNVGNIANCAVIDFDINRKSLEDTLKP